MGSDTKAACTLLGASDGTDPVPSLGFPGARSREERMDALLGRGQGTTQDSSSGAVRNSVAAKPLSPLNQRRSGFGRADRKPDHQATEEFGATGRFEGVGAARALEIANGWTSRRLKRIRNAGSGSAQGGSTRTITPPARQSKIAWLSHQP
jgi:hypothetical protein